MTYDIFFLQAKVYKFIIFTNDPLSPTATASSAGHGYNRRGQTVSTVGPRPVNQLPWAGLASRPSWLIVGIRMGLHSAISGVFEET